MRKGFMGKYGMEYGGVSEELARKLNAIPCGRVEFVDGAYYYGYEHGVNMVEEADDGDLEIRGRRYNDLGEIEFNRDHNSFVGKADTKDGGYRDVLDFMVGHQVVLLTKEDIQDLVTTALCGGIGYWARLDNSTDDFENAPKDECIDETVARLLIEGKSVKLIDEEDGDVIDWTLVDLFNGVKRYFASGRGADLINRNRIDMCNVDADVADMMVQLGLWNEVIYG